MTICGPFAEIHVLMNEPHPGGARQRSDACFCEFLWILCEIKKEHPVGSVFVIVIVQSRLSSSRRPARAQRRAETCLSSSLNSS